MSFIGFFVSPNLFFQLLLQLLALVILTKTLVLVFLNLFLNLNNLLFKLLSFHSELSHKLAKCKVPLLSLNEVSHKLINVLSACCFKDAVEGLLVLFKLFFRDKDLRDFVAWETPESLLRLTLKVELLLLLGLFVEPFQLILLTFFRFHEFLHLLFLLYLLINLLNLLVKVCLLLLCLSYKLN